MGIIWASGLEECDTKAFAHEVKPTTLTVTALPNTTYLSLMLLTMPAPYVLYTSIVDSGQTPVTGWLQPFLFLLLSTLALAWVAHQRVGNAWFFVVGLICLAVTEFVWASDSTDPTDMWAYPLLLLVVMIRVRRWLVTPSLSEENRTSFVLETIVTVVSTLFIVLTQSHGGIREWLVFVLVVSLGLRLVMMWQVERLETSSKGAKGHFGLILLSTVLLLWLGPKVVYWGVLALAGGGAIMSLPLLYLLNAILPKNLLAKGLRQHMPIQNLVTQMQKQQQQVAQAHSLHWLLYLFYVIALVALIVFVWRVSKRRLGSETSTDEAGVTVERKRVSRLEQLRFIATANPVRKRYQDWLLEQDRAGHRISPSETPRQYAARIMKDETEGTSSTSLTELTGAYEDVRYGPDTESDSDSKTR